MKIRFIYLFIFLLSWGASIFAETKEPIVIWESDNKADTPELTFYPTPQPSDICIVVCPGGGYGAHAIQPEGYGIAKWLNKNGIHAAVLKYRLPKGRHALPLEDAKNAIKVMRQNSDKYKFSKDKVGIMGFSAGGHLAASTTTLLDIHERPNFGVFIYPVISFGAHGHKGSRNNLIGTPTNKELVERYSLEKQVDQYIPPVFLTHAIDDKVVVIENSQMFYKEAIKFQKQSMLIELSDGGHGLNGYKGASWDKWQTETLKWIKNLKL